MKNILSAFLNLFRFHKLKILTLALSLLGFAVLLFPFNDLSDLVSSKVSQATANQVYVEFERLELNFGLNPGLRMEKALVEGRAFPTVEADSMVISPWFWGLVMFRKGAYIGLDGLFKGFLHINYHEAESLKNGNRLQNIDIKAEEIALASVNDFLRAYNGLNLGLQGKLGFKSQMAIDPGFTQQPQGTFELSVNNFAATNPTITFMSDAMGPDGPIKVPLSVELPPVKLGKVLVRGGLKEGRISLDEVTFGEAKDMLYAKIKGEVYLTIRNLGGQVLPDFANYDLRVDLTMASELQTQLGTFLSAVNGLDSVKKQVSGGYRYPFRIQGRNFASPPNVSAIE